ncbi:MAG: type II toxin-antitoxin system PemK/MazF family toxin [Coriobacteriaceae bacterium]|nr:type II toxin-antitoxin system PemK/MazF family toxin [Coriobacteriaceae bacterium]
MAIFDQWDIVEFDLSPSSGHEPNGRRPALVVSNSHFNVGTSMTLVCPITSASNGFPLHLPLPDSLETRGFVVTEQLRALDFSARRAQLIERLDDKALSAAILECLRSFI